VAAIMAAQQRGPTLWTGRSASKIHLAAGSGRERAPIEYGAVILQLRATDGKVAAGQLDVRTWVQK
jgi:hypothetical protein